MANEMTNKNFEVVNRFVMRSLDKRIEAHGLTRGIAKQLYSMRKLKLKIGTVPMHFIEDTLLYELKEFEKELQDVKLIAANEGIGAYRFNDDFIELFLVQTRKGVKLM
jgi:hypothetical protein